ncbi:MAG: DUF2922 domain-containing protein [Phascolarctobacterium sp.]|nr:DUF2922 domain-containing protein [Candidatus Phascolarctobacterium caballi]
MGTTVTLVLVFIDEESNECSIVVKDPAEDLSLETVTAAMQNIISNDAILTNAGKHLESVGNCYYKTITTTPLTSEDGE